MRRTVKNRAYRRRGRLRLIAAHTPLRPWITGKSPNFLGKKQVSPCVESDIPGFMGNAGAAGRSFKPPPETVQNHAGGHLLIQDCAQNQDRSEKIIHRLIQRFHIKLAFTNIIIGKSENAGSAGSTLIRTGPNETTPQTARSWGVVARSQPGRREIGISRFRAGEFRPLEVLSDHP